MQVETWSATTATRLDICRVIAPMSALEVEEAAVAEVEVETEVISFV